MVHVRGPRRQIALQCVITMVAAWAVQGRSEEEARGVGDGKSEGKQMDRVQYLAFSASNKRAQAPRALELGMGKSLEHPIST
jgi:hypothetical protein